MNIILFGGTGTIGQRIYSEAVSRGHQVAVFVRPGREIQLSPRPAKVIEGDLAKADDIAAAVHGQSAVVSALGPRGDDANGKSEISAEDYAVGLIDELETAQALRKRITFAW
jgi:putative NADH-flavin reductase